MALPQMFLVSAVITGISFILFLAGYGSNVWFEYKEGSFGLWKYCNQIACEELTDNLLFSQLYLARLFCSIALILLIISLVFLFLFGFKDARKIYALVSYVCLDIAGFLNLIGAAALLSQTPVLEATVGWGGILTAIAGIMQMVSSLFIIIPVRRGQIEYTTT